MRRCLDHSAHPAATTRLWLGSLVDQPPLTQHPLLLRNTASYTGHSRPSCLIDVYLHHDVYPPFERSEPNIGICYKSHQDFQVVEGPWRQDAFVRSNYRGQSAKANYLPTWTDCRGCLCPTDRTPAATRHIAHINRAAYMERFTLLYLRVSIRSHSWSTNIINPRFTILTHFSAAISLSLPRFDHTSQHTCQRKEKSPELRLAVGSCVTPSGHAFFPSECMQLLDSYVYPPPKYC